MMIDDSNWPFKIEKILRIIPNKRITAVATWQEKKVIAKVFLPHVFAKTNFEKELNNNLFLQQKKIFVPKILAHGPLSASSFYLLTHYHEDAISFQQVWQDLNQPEEKIKYFQQLFDLIQLLHEKAMLQDDLHLRNFLIAQDQLITLDAGSFVIEKEKLAPQICEMNWGKLLAQFNEEEAQWLGELFFQKNNKIFLHEKKWRKKQIQHYLKKIFRNSTDFFSEKKWQHYFVYHKNFSSEDLSFFLENPEKFLKKNTIKILKSGNSCTVFQVKFADKNYVIKRYNIKSKWHQLKRAFKSTRAATSWYYAHLLQWLNIPTPTPVAFLEKRFGVVKKEAYFVMEYIPGTSLMHYVEEHRLTEQTKKWLKKAIELIKKLGQYHIEHGDLKASNFLIGDEKILVLDLDSMQQIEPINQQKDYDRFIKNWLDFPEIKQYVLQELDQKEQ